VGEEKLSLKRKAMLEEPNDRTRIFTTLAAFTLFIAKI
jgi:hypothetical protein